MAYLLTRLLHGVGVVFGVSLIVFGLTWLTGDPAAVLLPRDTPPAEVARLRSQLGLDRPLPVQYADFVGRAARGDFGDSFRYRAPALPIVVDRLPNTLALMGTATLLAVAFALPLGLLAVRFPGRLPDLLARTASLLAQSLAAPWLGVMLILVFAVQLRWLPSSGLQGPQSLVLPAIVAAAYPAAGLTRLLRTRVLEVLANDYVTVARSKGLAPGVVIWRHALRNAALPVLAFLGLQVTFLFGNTIVAEALFAYPGMGRLAVDAIASRDMPLIQAFVAVSALVVVLVNLVLDLVYAWIDPRVRLS